MTRLLTWALEDSREADHAEARKAVRTALIGTPSLLIMAVMAAVQNF